MPIFIPGRVSWPSCRKLSECFPRIWWFCERGRQRKERKLVFQLLYFSSTWTIPCTVGYTIYFVRLWNTSLICPWERGNLHKGGCQWEKDFQALSCCSREYVAMLLSFFVIKFRFFSVAVVRKINTRLLNVERAFINLEEILQANPLQR